MTIKDLISSLEEFAPLRLQENYDNSGLQAGIAVQELKAVMIALDITEDVVDEAVRRGCNMVVTHHPLIFQPLKTVSDFSYQQRCVIKALKNDVLLYSMHTNLDNVEGGVNHRIAEKLGLADLDWIEAMQPIDGRNCGSGLIGTLPQAEEACSFLRRVKTVFKVPCLFHSELPAFPIRRVALCGGSGSFLMPKARELGADCFITGEISYHRFFENDGMLIAALGHYHSEQYTQELIKDIVMESFPAVRVEMYGRPTDPVKYLI